MLPLRGIAEQLLPFALPLLPSFVFVLLSFILSKAERFIALSLYRFIVSAEGGASG